MDIRFSSILKARHRGALEKLLFFNEKQCEFISEIEDSIEKYGMPAVTEDGGTLRIKVGPFEDLQSIFAFETEKDGLIGLVLFHRKDDAVIVLHIAVGAEFSSTGVRSEEMLAMRLLNKVLDSASKIKDIKHVVLAYGGESGNRVKIPVRKS